VPRSQNGLGLDSIHVLYSSEKVKFLRNVLKTPDTYCRLTSLECLDAIHQKLSFRRDVLRPSLGKIHSRNAAWNHLPDFYKEGHEALSNLGWNIGRNVESSSIQNISAEEFLAPRLGTTSSNILDELYEQGFTNMQSRLLPSLLQAGPNGETCPLEDALSSTIAEQRYLIALETENLYQALRLFFPAGLRRPSESRIRLAALKKLAGLLLV
jgi:hypothetical protein